LYLAVDALCVSRCSVCVQNLDVIQRTSSLFKVLDGSIVSHISIVGRTQLDVTYVFFKNLFFFSNETEINRHEQEHACQMARRRSTPRTIVYSCNTTYPCIVANGFDEHALDAQARFRQHPDHVLPALLGTVRRIEGGHADPVLAHVGDQIGERRIAGGVARLQALLVVRVVKVRGHKVAEQLTTIIAHVEDLTGDIVEERQEATNALGNMSFACAFINMMVME